MQEGVRSDFRSLCKGGDERVHVRCVDLLCGSFVSAKGSAVGTEMSDQGLGKLFAGEGAELRLDVVQECSVVLYLSIPLTFDPRQEHSNKCALALLLWRESW